MMGLRYSRDLMDPKNPKNPIDPDPKDPVEDLACLLSSALDKQLNRAIYPNKNFD